MTALWIAIVLLGCAVLGAIIANFMLWVYTAALTSVVNQHRRDRDLHWFTGWDDDGDSGSVDA